MATSAEIRQAVVQNLDDALDHMQWTHPPMPLTEGKDEVLNIECRRVPLTRSQWQVRVKTQHMGTHYFSIKLSENM